MKHWSDFWGMMFGSCFLRLIFAPIVFANLGDLYLIVVFGGALFDALIFYAMCRVASYHETLLEQKESLKRGLEDLAAGKVTAVDIDQIIKDAE